MYASRRVWEAKVGSDGVQQGPDEKKGCFGDPEFKDLAGEPVGEIHPIPD